MNRSLTAVRGVLAGHATDTGHHTGVTVALFPEGARGAAFVPGSATGSRELGALEPGHLAGDVHGFCLAGGSAFGLAAADGVMRVLEQRGVGFRTAAGVVPIVPAAILYDLHTATRRPDAALGEAAAEAAGSGPLAEGRVGAATGARVGAATGAPVPGGFGGWAERADGLGTVAAGVAVNALGAIVAHGRVVAGAQPRRGLAETGGAAPGPVDAGSWRGQTTLAIVATDAALDRAQCGVVARMASAGFARTIFPAFTPFDGDLVLVAATGVGPRPPPAALLELGDLAADAVARAIVRAVGG